MQLLNILDLGWILSPVQVCIVNFPNLIIFKSQRALRFLSQQSGLHSSE